MDGRADMFQGSINGGSGGGGHSEKDGERRPSRPPHQTRSKQSGAEKIKQNTKKVKAFMGWGVVVVELLIMFNGSKGNSGANERDLDGVVRCEQSGLCPA